MECCIARVILNAAHKEWDWIGIVVLRYAHLGADHLAEYAEWISKLKVIRTNHGTETKNALPQIAARR